MVYHFFKLFMAQGIVNYYGIPVLLVHMVARLHAFVLIPEFYSPVGIAFGIELQWLGIKAHQQKYLTTNLENKSIWSKRQTLFHI